MSLIAWGAAAACLLAQVDFDDPERVFANERVIDPSWQTGVPLGGVGTGFLEWGADGEVRTVGAQSPGFNDRPDPVTTPSGHFVVDVRFDGRRESWPLVWREAASTEDARGFEGVRFRGSFPRGFWSFDDSEAPVSVFMEAFSPLIPHDRGRSSLSMVGVRLRITSRVATPIEVGVGFLTRGDAWAGTNLARAGQPGDWVAVAPGEVCELKDVLAWDQYRRTHDHSPQDLLEDFDRLHADTRAWQELVHRSELPLWYRDRLINDLAPLVTNSYMEDTGLFGIREAGRGLGAILGTLDQRLVAHVAVQSFFPELDRVALTTFASQQRDDGEVQHHFGRAFVGLEPDKGFLGWPDLAASFLLQVDKHLCWTGDQSFRDVMAEPAEKAMRWLIAADRDGDGIPEGGSTFDDAHRGDGLSYNASIALAAFHAAARFLRRAGRAEAADDALVAAERTRRGMIDHLWNGRYFAHYVDPTTREASTDCFLGQLAGEWYAALMGLGPLLPEGMIDRSLSSMVGLNGAASPWIPPLEVTADGRIGRTPYGWLPYTEVYYAALLAYRGRADVAIECLRRIDAMLVHARDPFNVVLYYDAVTGEKYKPGYEWYMSTPASWFTLFAFLGVSVDLIDQRLTLAPNPPSAWRHFSGPAFFPTFTAFMTVDDAVMGLRRRIDFEVTAEHGGAPSVVREIVVGLPELGGRDPSIALSHDGASIPVDFDVDRSTSRATVRLERPLGLSAGARLSIEVTDAAIEAAAREHLDAVAERTVTLRNEHLDVTLVRGEAGFSHVAITELAGGATVALEAEHLFRLRLRGEAPEVWETDPARTRAVRVRSSELVAGSGAGAPSCGLRLEVDVRRRSGEPLPVTVEVTVTLAVDAPRLSWSCRVTGIDRSDESAMIEFPILRVRDPGRIGEESVLVRGDESVRDAAMSDRWEGPWTRAGGTAVRWVGPEAEISFGTADGGGEPRSVNSRGTRGDAVELLVRQPVAVTEGALATRVPVVVEWRRR